MEYEVIIGRSAMRDLEQIHAYIARDNPDAAQAFVSRLLDGSAMIIPQHHYAAMAVWSYSEQSARWIFGTATGDKNADKILAALRQAGREGMTRTEISEKIFLRHLSSAALSDALRIVQESGWARCTQERSGSNIVDRWSVSEVAN